MSLHAVASWLKNPEFKSGVELYKKYGNNPTKLFFFENGAYGLNKLIKEIQCLNIKEKKTTVKPAIIVEKKKYPLHISELKKQADKAWKEARDLHSTILETKNKNKRKLMAQRILELRPLAFELWQKVDHFEATGDLSFLVKDDEVNSIDKLNLNELITRTKNIPGYITKFKSQLKTAKDKTKIDYLMKMIAAKEMELKAIYERLNFLNDKIIELCL